MGWRAKWEYFREIYWHYRKASGAEKGRMLDEFCRVCRYSRKYAIRKLSGPPPGAKPERRRRRRRPVYGSQVISILREVWEAAGYPWSVRLKALLPLWLTWVRRRFSLSEEIEKQLPKISPRQMDRRLSEKKRKIRKRLYGRTKPGTLLRQALTQPLDRVIYSRLSPRKSDFDTVRDLVIETRRPRQKDRVRRIRGRPVRRAPVHSDRREGRAPGADARTDRRLRR